MMNWGRKKTFQSTNVPLKKKDGAESKSGNAQRKWNKEKYEDEGTICNSDYVIKDSKLKNMNSIEIMLMLKNERKRSKQGRKVNVHSPRARIKALENMKRKRLMMKEMKAFSMRLDCNVIVKSSFDPEREFRESMMEMMIEKGIRRRDELVELLACYLTLNCDEYHHLIVKVFQQTYNQFVEL